MRSIKSQTEYEALIKDGEVLEKDGHGIKVFRLPGDRILKLFRRKRILSSQLWFPYAYRFKRNADTLRKRGFTTVTVDSVFSIPSIQRHGVLYQSLPGITLRSWLQAHNGSDASGKIADFGRLVAQLHEKGVLFRSLHLGNVLVLPNGGLGLIDISDMGFRWIGPLFHRQRIRNLVHVARYPRDVELIASCGGDTFEKAYLSTVRVKSHQIPALSAQMRALKLSRTESCSK